MFVAAFVCFRLAHRRPDRKYQRGDARRPATLPLGLCVTAMEPGRPSQGTLRCRSRTDHAGAWKS